MALVSLSDDAFVSGPLSGDDVLALLLSIDGAIASVLGALDLSEDFSTDGSLPDEELALVLLDSSSITSISFSLASAFSSNGSDVGGIGCNSETSGASCFDGSVGLDWDGDGGTFSGVSFESTEVFGFCSEGCCGLFVAASLTWIGWACTAFAVTSSSETSSQLLSVSDLLSSLFI